MKGFIKQTAAAVGMGAALFTVLGCTAYRNVVDPCWPERYSKMSRESTREMLNAQADKGHKLDTTVWNMHFDKDAKTGEPGAALNQAGKAFLLDISRRQPFPDPQLWLEYPFDVKDASQRNQMIADRKASIRNFLATETKLASAAFQIDVHDHVQPTYPAEWTQKAYNQVDIQGKLSGGSSSSGSGSSSGGSR